jgi:hypothetical protein
MYALFEDSGKFMTGRVMSEAEASAQIELDSGKRMKVKSHGGQASSRWRLQASWRQDRSTTQDF